MTENKTCCQDCGHFKEIDAFIDELAQKGSLDGKLIAILHKSQELIGYLPEDVQAHIARRLSMPAAKVYGVVSFYSFFSTVPRGKHTIRVCLGTACYVRGGKRVVEHLQQKLGIDLGDTTQDGLFTLEVARCIGACGLAPAMLIDDQVFRKVNVNKLDAILANYSNNNDSEDNNQNQNQNQKEENEVINL